MAWAGSDLGELSAQCRRLDERLRAWLSEQGIGLQEYATLEEFARSVRG